MNPTKEKLDAKLRELETITGVSEVEIYLELRRLRIDTNGEAPCRQWIYESMAFSFIEAYNAGQYSAWETHFGPMRVWQEDNGETIEEPSIKDIDKSIIEYWEQRSKSTNNPLLQARYAGLVWDLSELALGVRPSHTTAIRCCEAIVKIANLRAHRFEMHIIFKLKLALSIAISLNRTELITRIKQAILNYEDNAAEDSKPGLWGFSFDLLVGNKRVDLSDEEEQGLIDVLEARLERLREGDPWICELAAERLAHYYRRKGMNDDCSRVIKILGHAFESATVSAEPLQAAFWLNRIHHIYVQFNLSADADRVAIAIREVGPKVVAAMKPIVHEMKMSPEKFEAYIDQMIDGELEHAFKRIVIHYIPQRKEIENQLHDLGKIAPLGCFLTSKQITDHEGRVVASIGSVADDLDGNVVNQMSQNMAISVIFLDAVLRRLIDKVQLNSEKIINYLFRSPVFNPNQKELLLRGVNAYLEGDYVVSIHILIPQIEATIRNLIETSGGVVLRRGRGGGFGFRMLDDILRDDVVTQALGEDAALYLRVVLTDQRGWNIRNNVSHGLLRNDQFSKGFVDRLVHILLVLAQLRIKEGPCSK